jgi:GT2 family glycosyltransferase
MLIIYHNKNKVIEVIAFGTITLQKKTNLSVTETLFMLAKRHPDEILIWCQITLKNHLNLTHITSFFPHKKILLSFNPNCNFYLDTGIGYVEQSLFINVNKSVTFPTWQMSSSVGGIYAGTLLTLKGGICLDKDFDYFLNSLAKLAMPKGLFCYSEPKLLIQNSELATIKASTYKLFRFVKQHYKVQWIFLLLLDFLLYEKRIPLLPFFMALFYKNRNAVAINLERISLFTPVVLTETATIDVIIPTIGRKKYLYDVLCDLKVQTHVPKKVIIVEQNPLPYSVSELDFIEKDSWPFEIKHIFTHQVGACNARNVALQEMVSEWVFFADDDIRFENDFIEKTFEKINVFEGKAVTVNCLQKGQKQTENQVRQWNAFGSGCSFVQTEILKNCSFKMGYEFGFGEDTDFGMQIRNQGYDILYLPDPQILHLKAGVGGFRSLPILQWYSEKVQPKPSPTVMLYKVQHDTLSQILGYKTTLFFKYYCVQNIKNPIRYYFYFQKQWKQSELWANRLMLVE